MHMIKKSTSVYVLKKSTSVYVLKKSTSVLSSMNGKAPQGGVNYGQIA